jgi:uncharacterized OsmC-like protein
LGGEGEGPAPHELLPAALAACISGTLVVYANTKGWELGEVTSTWSTTTALHRDDST